MSRESFNMYDQITKLMLDAGHSAEECEDASLRFRFALKRCMRPKPGKGDVAEDEGCEPRE